MVSQGRALLDEFYAALFHTVRGPLRCGFGPPRAPRQRRCRGSLDRCRRLARACRKASSRREVLFVRGEPVAVFSDVGAAPNELELGRIVPESMVHVGAEMPLRGPSGRTAKIYSLNLPPKRGAPPGEPWRVLNSAADVLSLARDIDEFGPDLLMEAGGSALARADHQLIDDLRHVRKYLERTGLSMVEAHALIGRSILIRYLEDRGVLTRPYFEGVASDNPAWRRVLDTEGQTPVFGPSRKGRLLYDRVLCDACFTHALFQKLADDFNGDLFALGEARDKRFEDAALQLLRKFLLGEIQAGQQPLFFWAYDFEVVPLALISSIYEQFYHDAREEDGISDEEEEDAGEGGTYAGQAELGDQQVIGDRQVNSGTGTHYTPASLVHDALRRTLTPACLALKPKVLDLACGSGIFLVEAFRRIVRFEAQGRRQKLLPFELRNILGTG